MTKEEFFTKCANHDWYYDYSDDHSVWRRGQAAQEILMAEAAKDPAKAKIYADWKKYINNRDLPKPELE